LEISYNQKSSPKKLFAETSKKNKNENGYGYGDLIQNTYANEIINTHQNYYVACLTDENEVRISSKYDNKKLDKNIEKFLVKKIYIRNLLKKLYNTEKNCNKIQQQSSFLNSKNKEPLEKNKLKLNLRKQNIQIKPITLHTLTLNNLKSKSPLIIKREINSNLIEKEKKENLKKRFINKGEYNHNDNEHLHESLFNQYQYIDSSFSNKVNLDKKDLQIFSEERKVFNTEDNNNNNNNEINPADFITNNKGERKIDLNFNNNFNNFNNENKIKLEDGISINIIKSHGDQRIKKFFHIPDFEIYVIKVNI